MNDLGALQKLVGKALIALTTIQVLCLIALAAVIGANTATIGIAAVFFALCPIVINALRRPPQIVGLALAVALVGQTALLVFIFQGHSWQVEMHFYFFAVLAMLAGFCDVGVILTAAGLIAVHHLLFNALIPDALYPGGGDFPRMCVHVVIVVIEAAMLVMIARMNRASFATATEAAAMAQDAVERLHDAGTALEAELASSQARADALETTLHAFRNEIAKNLDGLSVAVTSLDATADDFSSAFGQTTTQATAVAKAADGATRRVSDVAAATREYLATMTEIGEHAGLSARMGEKAVRDAETTTSTIEELLSMSARIDEATKIITGIATQTNLLALNATIEAARAGEHGRGFSVVAAEVKQLSVATMKAASSIADIVTTIQGSTKRSVGAVASIAASIRSLNDATAIIADAVQERVFVASGMAENVDNAAADVRKVATAIETIEAVSGRSCNGANLLRVAAGDIAGRTESIRRHVEIFTAGGASKSTASREFALPS